MNPKMAKQLKGLQMAVKTTVHELIPIISLKPNMVAAPFLW